MTYPICKPSLERKNMLENERSGIYLIPCFGLILCRLERAAHCILLPPQYGCGGRHRAGHWACGESGCNQHNWGHERMYKAVLWTLYLDGVLTEGLWEVTLLEAYKMSYYQGHLRRCYWGHIIKDLWDRLWPLEELIMKSLRNTLLSQIYYRN